MNAQCEECNNTFNLKENTHVSDYDKTYTVHIYVQCPNCYHKEEIAEVSE